MLDEAPAQGQAAKAAANRRTPKRPSGKPAATKSQEKGLRPELKARATACMEQRDRRSPKPLLQLEAPVAAPVGHVRDDDLIAGAESLLDLHAVGRDAAENHVDAASLLVIVRKLEQGKRRAGTCLERPFHISGRRNLLDFDCATCGKVRARLVRLRAGEFQSRC
jgi:hypothetical protein